MKVFVMFQAVFVLSDMILKIEADLSLTVTSPLGESTISGINMPHDFECNAKATFLCEIKPYEDSAIWEINGETYALCIFQDCFTYPPFPENHIITMDVESGVFNLTVDPVTNSTNNNIYKCDDGITARSVEANVKVYPTNETLTMDTTAEERITVTTGCVYPNGIDDVTFEWYISKYNTTLVPEPFNSKKNESTVVFDCTETPSCTVEQTSHYNNTVVFDVSADWEEYYIYVIIKHNDALNRSSAVQSTGRRYKVNKVTDVLPTKTNTGPNPPTRKPNEFTSPKPQLLAGLGTLELVVISCAVVLGIVFIMVCICYCARRGNRQKNNDTASDLARRENETASDKN